MKSRITGGRTLPLFNTTVLGKYDVQYFRCVDTGFIQTEEPYWLEEAYAEVITSLDIGLLARNIANVRATACLIDGWFDSSKTFIDYGGGYGVFVRLMRDVGYDFRRIDPYCDNLFAKHFDWDLDCKSHAEILTAWEVFEHLPDPMESVSQLLHRSDTILFSTVLAPRGPITTPDDWWYFTPETGQHVSLYSREALEHIAGHHGCHFFTDGVSMHLLTRRPIANPFYPRVGWKTRLLLWRAIRRLTRRGDRHSLLPKDFAALRMRLGER